MSTVSAKAESVERKWYLVDAEGRVLGRIAAKVAAVLKGKHKPIYTPHADTGDFVIVINAGKMRLTGGKLEDKVYYRHSGYPGGLKSITAGKLMKTRPEEVLMTAVRGMLPKNPLGRRMIMKMKVYGGPDHPHAAQAPEPLEIKA